MPAVLSKFVKPETKKIPNSKKEFSCLSRQDAGLMQEFVWGTWAKGHVLKKVDGAQLLLGEHVRQFGDSSVLKGWEFVNDTRETRKLDAVIEYGKQLFDAE